jgi:hypothetical protein
VHDITKATLYGTYSYELFQQAYSFRPFLRTILRDPQLSTYVRIGKLRVWRTAADVYSFLNEPDPPRREDLQLFVDAGRYVSLNSEPDWYESIIRGVEDAEVMLLVSQLPNLQELHLAMPPSTRLRWHFVLNEAQKARNGVSAMYHSLRKLCVENGAGEGGFQVGTLAPFLALPSLRTFEAYQCQEGLWTAANFNNFAEQNQGTFGVTSINLEWSTLSIEAITAIITSCKALKIFKFSHHWKTASRLTHDQFTTSQLIEALSIHQDTLEHLKLDLHSGWDPQLWLPLLDEERFRFGDLRQFHKLITLDAEQTALMTENPEAQLSSGHFGEILPASLETLIIRSCSDLVYPFISELAQAYNQILPRIKTLRLTATKELRAGFAVSNPRLWTQRNFLKGQFDPHVDFNIDEKPDNSTGLSGFRPPPPSWRS